jgi:hypothetical protein
MAERWLGASDRPRTAPFGCFCGVDHRRDPEYFLDSEVREPGYVGMIEDMPG